MLASFLSLLTLVTIAAAAFGLGRPLVRALGVAEEDALTTGVFSVGAGLIAAGVGLAALGFAGLLYKSVIGVLSLAAAFYGVAQLGQACRARYQTAKTLEPPGAVAPCAPPRAAVRQALFWLAATAAAGSLIAALAPPTAGDALCYHLELPKRFLLEHTLVFLPDSDNSTFPLMAELWYLWALALDGPVAAQLVHWGLGLLLALASAVLATPLLGRRWAWCVAATVLLTPLVSNQMTAPLNDVAVAVMATLALSAWWRAVFDHETTRYDLLAGWFAGGALAIKYVAMLYLAATAVVTLMAIARRGPTRAVIMGGCGAALVAACVCGPWYLRAAWHTGNPVYPFFNDVLSGAQPTALFAEPGTAASPRHLPLSGRPVLAAPHLAVACALSPWQITMHPERFGGRGHQLGILFLATLPGLLFCRRLRGLRFFLSISLLYFVAWYGLRPNVRFLLPILPLLCTGVVWVWMEWRRLPAGPRRCLGCLTAAILLVGAAIAPLRARDRWPVALGIETRDAYLLRCEPSYRAAAWANALLAPDDCILSQEQRGFYFNTRLARENVFRRRTQYDRRLASPGLLSQTLRGAGFTHLLLAEAVSGPVHYNATLSRLADQASSVRPDTLECLAECEVVDNEGSVRRYRLIALR
ncbi:MAG TPA: hypothetical protein VF306_07870 [Pirellulales bacterium]